MTVIRQDDLIQSVADALQFISYYHPTDFLRAMVKAWEAEESPAAKAALNQVLVNSRMCALGKRPICQDTGIVMVFLKVGMEVRWEGDLSLEDMINEGVRRGYMHPDNVLRASVLADPDGSRSNTKDNTPAIIHTRIVPGNSLEGMTLFLWRRKRLVDLQFERVSRGKTMCVCHVCDALWEVRERHKRPSIGNKREQL